MTVFYNIAGRQIGSHYLAIATLSTVFGGAYYALSGGSSAAKKSQGPPLNAQSPDEEKFIKDFLASADKKDNSADATKKDAAH
ncbi:ATP synthase subunit K, mitochondrial [Lachnellula hyalina]|uniref:ATP synthase subunit K, mitochondrial n=1 Tax=Lachnellula hyalina TaxID=1316788 RepID=A0A8H8R7Z7_9HELO|nr:ATP synthase subunit K, mitochondrial [Lachnellula hyalina]TVY30225.1 ATP synthase subunit K, mitochondrial [Lachnellula hyalina]